MRTAFWLTVVAVLTLSGCELLGLNSCTTEGVAGIGVMPLDSITNGPVAADTVQIVATDGAYADTVRVPNTGAGLAYERLGTYTVEVTAAGYARWVRSGVRVRMRGDGCHVQTVVLTALMQRLASS